MNDDKAEHRGWQTNAEFTPHILDDPTYDLAEDEMESGSPTFWLIVSLAVVLSGGCLLLGKWLEPPRLVFAAPAPPPLVSYVQQTVNVKDGSACPMFNPGLLSVSCLYIDGKQKVARPNYENPYCQKEFMARIKK